MATSFHPLAYAREAERLSKLAKRAELEMDYRGAARLQRLAREMGARSQVH